MLILAILSTSYELYTIYFPKKSFGHGEIITGIDPNTQSSNGGTSFSQRLLLSFSIISNSKMLTRESKRFANIDTIRLFGSLNVVLLNYYMVTVSYAYLNKETATLEGFTWKYATDWKYVLVRNRALVDLHFCISGLLLVYLMLSKLDRTNKFDYFKYLLNRYLRFVPSLAAVIMCYYWIPHVGDGPMYDVTMEYMLPPCRVENKLLPTLFMYTNFRVNPVDGFTVRHHHRFIYATIK